MTGSAVLILGMAALAPTAALAAPPVTPAAPAAGSGPEDQGAAKGAPASPAPAAAPTPTCDLTDPDSADHEFLSCVTADAELAAAPPVGGTTTGSVVVRTDVQLDGATITLSFNEHLSLVGAAGFGRATDGRSGVGPVSTVSRTVTLAAGATTTYGFTVKAESKGFGIVQAAVDGGDARRRANDEAAVTLGGGETPGALGGYAVEEAPAGTPQAPAATGRTYVPAPVVGPEPLSPSAPGASCATGRWVYNNELGQQVGSMNYQIQAYDQDAGGTDDLLAVGVTGGNGNYNICFESTDSDGGGGQEIYLKFLSSNNAWRVRNTAAANNSYDFNTGVVAIADPGTVNFGTLQPGDAALHRALHAFDALNSLFLWQSGVNGSCIDDPGQCRQMVLNWTTTSTDGTYYSLEGNDIHLDSNDPDSDHITVHEGSHALMDALFEDDYPPFPNCSPHSIFGASSTGCAWTEGWAEWVPARVLNDPFFRFEDGTGPNLETPGWTDGQTRGDAVEGRIAGALIDLSDGTNEAPWDRYTEGGGGAAQEEIYTTMVNEVSDTLSDYFNVRRPGEGDTGYLARAAVFQNTIDYNHRDPLTSGQALTRPSLSVAPSPHNYSYNTAAGYWSGVAIRGANDNDLAVYDDPAQTSLLASSSFGGAAIDYVLVDSNHRALGDYFPRASLFSGSGSYGVQLDAGAVTLAQGSASVPFSSSDVIKVRDAFASAGVVNYVRVVPTAGLDVEVAAHRSDPASAGSLVQGRSAAVASSAGGGAGAAESVQYTSPTDDWTGLVILNRGGSGTATVYRDESVPQGTVSIDNGAASTADRDVDLTLAASDPQTGILDMRVSVDGAFDSETWEPYATSTTVTLPTGPGAKTVDVQFRNNAGAVTAASDAITLIGVPGPPTVTSSTPSGGAVVVAFTAPSNNGGGPITSYTAQCVEIDGGGYKALTGPSSPLKVTGLNPESYQCRVKATNAAGPGPYSAYGATVVVTRTAPDAPAVTSSTPSGGAVSVAFNVPANGGSPIISYTAQCVEVDGGGYKALTGAASPLKVGGLNPEDYHCRVKATNAVGASAFGTYGATVMVTAGVPGAPAVTSSTPSAGAVSVAFTPPASNGGSPITGYTAQCVEVDGGGYKARTGPSSPLNVTGLNAESYRCRVKATSAVGPSAYSTYGATVSVPAGRSSGG